MIDNKPRHYDEEFKLRAVMLFESGEKSLNNPSCNQAHITDTTTSHPGLDQGSP